MRLLTSYYNNSAEAVVDAESDEFAAAVEEVNKQRYREIETDKRSMYLLSVCYYCTTMSCLTSLMRR